MLSGAGDNRLHWHLIKRSTFELSAGAILPDTTPLLEEERSAMQTAGTLDFSNPIGVHRASARPERGGVRIMPYAADGGAIRHPAVATTIGW